MPEAQQISEHRRGEKEQFLNLHSQKYDCGTVPRFMNVLPLHAASGLQAQAAVTDQVKVLHPTGQKISHFRDILPEPT